MPVSLSAPARDRIARNLEEVRQRMARAALKVGRRPEEITLIAVTKSVGVGEVEALYELGVRHFGENRPEHVAEKISALPADATWHAIGNLQRRKARVALEHFACIDAVDRLELAETLQSQAAELQRNPRVLLEVNVSGEETKHGFTPAGMAPVLESMQRLSALRLQGLMTMAPFGAPEPQLRQVFSQLRELAQRHALPVLSMGMTDDFETAIEEGATEVRIGRALFE